MKHIKKERKKETFHNQSPVGKFKGYWVYLKFAYLVLVLLLILGCNGCPNEVIISTVSGPDFTACGGFDWKVAFNLERTSIDGGIIVQEVRYISDILNCDNSQYENVILTYWKAWEVDVGQCIEEERVAGNIDCDNNYYHKDNPNTKGYIWIESNVRFFENQVLPASFIPNNPNTNAGDLPSTTMRPEFWNREDSTVHDLSVTWDCCDDAGFLENSTVPEVSAEGAGLKTSPLETDTNYIANMIFNIPAWTENYQDIAVLNPLISYAREIALVPQGDLKTGVQQFYDAYKNKPDSVAQLSKIYLLLRVLYDVPISIDRSEVKVFGGWVHPSVRKKNEPFNLLWPVIVSKDSTITVPGQLSGYLGRPYNAPGELLYFHSNFERRIVIR